MVKLNRIYTRTGDDGHAVLGSGERRPKWDLRMAAYGTVDEANATVGLARLHASGEIDQVLLLIQNDLFDLGADLAVPETDGEEPGKALRIVSSQTERLEREIDRFNARLEPLRSFVLPAGSKLAAHLHLARTVTRRAERLVAELAGQPGEIVNAEALRYVNRLSDLLFVLARVANDDGRTDVLWQPGATR
ncbi:MAG TPA: cob(I)yrinic acid a,c-diamide adenosyltransferase [Mesorhizobium sp.]|jgi:cob(I)alamin adenosyltransferase|nr:cob(I)yrinic acid a,c-diamide adenosyltransferase [Mesorhizobium sp.]